MSTIKKHQIAAKKETYRILAVKNQMYEFEVIATSPEDACKTLQERLRTNNTFDVSHKVKPQLSTWCDPNEKGDAWVVEGGGLSRDLTGKILHIWNGKEILSKEISK